MSLLAEIVDALPPVEYGPNVSRAEFSVFDHAEAFAYALAAFGFEVHRFHAKDSSPVEHTLYVVEVIR